MPIFLVKCSFSQFLTFLPKIASILLTNCHWVMGGSAYPAQLGELDKWANIRDSIVKPILTRKPLSSRLRTYNVLELKVYIFMLSAKNLWIKIPKPHNQYKHVNFCASNHTFNICHPLACLKTSIHNICTQIGCSILHNICKCYPKCNIIHMFLPLLPLLYCHHWHCHCYHCCHSIAIISLLSQHWCHTIAIIALLS